MTNNGDDSYETEPPPASAPHAPTTHSSTARKNANGIFEEGERVVGTLELGYTDEIDATDGEGLNAIDGIDVAKGDDGTLLFKVVDNAGKVVGTKAIEVDF